MMTTSPVRVTPVILCGGSGTRLWPLSRRTAPKQFVKIGDELSLYQNALQRLDENDLYDPPLIITNADYRFQVSEQALELGIGLGAILLEPSARNTAAAIGAAAALCELDNPECLLHVLPSDHYVTDDKAYRSACAIAAETAQLDHLVTFGIEPTKPATGYGYIKAGKLLDSGAYEVATFIEKPPLDEAQAMLDAGGYSWNSGMFMFRADTFMKELEQFEPAVADAARQAIRDAEKDLDFFRLDATSFNESPNISVDYAVFERTSKAAVVPASIHWLDIGSWQSMWESRSQDNAGNVLASGDATFENSENNLVISGRQHIALNGIQDVAVIATDDAILVSALDSSEQVKNIVVQLKAVEKTQLLIEEHKTVYRPWGGYTSILSGERFQVKTLFVTPGKKLSLQKHCHRSEHWVVVNGTAEVTIDNDIHTLSENESAYIPLGAVHRLANPGKIMLEVIEVQSGSYLGEDDIIRIEDDFGRGRTY